MQHDLLEVDLIFSFIFCAGRKPFDTYRLNNCGTELILIRHSCCFVAGKLVTKICKLRNDTAYKILKYDPEHEHIIFPFNFQPF